MRNVPPILRMVWDCGPKTVVWSILLRLALAGVPVAILAVSRWLINAIVVSLLDEFFARLKKSKALREELRLELRAHRGFLPS